MRAVLRVLVTVAVMSAAAFAQLAAQEPRLAGRLGEPARARVDSMLSVARASRLPTEPLVDRALEGVAKKAPEALIVSAVGRLMGELRLARQAFGEDASAAELNAGASALRAGATGAQLASLRRLRPGKSLTIAAGVFAELVAAGVPADTGIAAVLALASNAGDADYIAFRRNVERDIALGASPAASVGARLQVAAPMADEAGQSTGSPTRPRKRKP